MFARSFLVAVVVAVSLLTACGGSNSSSQTVPPTGAVEDVQVRFVDGATELDGIIGSTPQPVCKGPSVSCYLQVNGQTVSSQLYYSYITPFTHFNAGTLSLVAADTSGYTVGPLKTATLAAGGRYTIVIVGTYPNYKAVAYQEPASSSDAEVSLYEAAPALSQAAFGSFRVSTNSGYKQLGTAHFGQVTTVSVGKSVSDFGGYAGAAKKPIGTQTPERINGFDVRNVLPFHAIGRLSLFLFAGTASTPIQVFGSLDQ
jgi:hypothetical protein